MTTQANPSTPRRVLVLCTGNSCRSQMAEALINHDLAGRWHAESAGTLPAGYVHPEAVAVLAELGIDASRAHSKHADAFRDAPFDLVVTVCDHAAENCPVWLGSGARLHLPFRDPAAARGSPSQVRAAFRSVRDQIRQDLPRTLATWEASQQPARSPEPAQGE